METMKQKEEEIISHLNRHIFYYLERGLQIPRPIVDEYNSSLREYNMKYVNKYVNK